MSSNGESAVRPSEHGSIFFAKKPSNAEASAVSGKEKPGSIRPSVMVAADAGRLKRVLEARAEVRNYQRKGTLPATQAKVTKIASGWVPLMHTRHQKLVETAREHLGEVEMTLDERACVVSHDP